VVVISQVQDATHVDDIATLVVSEQLSVLLKLTISHIIPVLLSDDHLKAKRQMTIEAMLRHGGASSQRE
jgi:hypothetical protein